MSRSVLHSCFHFSQSLPGLGRWRGASALLPRLFVGGGAVPEARPAARSAPRPPPRAVRARPPLRSAAPPPRTASSSRAAPRRGAPRAGRPAPLSSSRPLSGRVTRGGRERVSRRERAGANAGSATRAAPLPQRRRRAGPCL